MSRLCLLLYWLSGCAVWPQSAPTPKSEPLLRISVNEVVLDVVVVDNKGRQLRGLGPDDFEILEDGVPQKLGFVRRIDSSVENDVPAVAGTAGATNRPRSENLTRSQVRQINLISLVFDRISLDGRQLAREAALAYFKELGPNDFASVMVIDRQLRVLIPFTQDVRRLDEAVALAVGGTPQQFADVSEALREALAQADASSDQAEAAAAGFGRYTGGPDAADGTAFAAAAMNQAVVTMLRRSALGEQSIQGYATVESLMNIVRGQRSLPGRKAVVFFGERIVLPNEVMERFRDLISAANRSNVSFYCIDTAGLESKGQLDSMSKEIARLAAVSKRQQMKRYGATTQEEVLLVENVGNAMRMPSQNTLVDLAESTGGVLVANTNDLLPGLRRVSEDFKSHYELSYAPSNPVYDGAFRRIAVRVKRADVTVRSREGYYAFPDNDLAESPFEAPLLEALQAKEPPHDVAFRSTSLVFPTPGARSDVVLYVEVPLSGFSFAVDREKQEYSSKVAVLAAIKNAEDRTVEKFSQEVPLRGPAEQAEVTQNRNFVFHRTTDLAPGRYRVEIVVRDPLGDKASVKRALLIVPGRRSGALGLSSVVLLKRWDNSGTGGADLDGPLVFGQQRLVPNLNSTLRMDDWSELAFYFVAVAPAGASPVADLVVAKDGKPFGRMGERSLPPPDERGRIRYVATLPLDSMTPGNYDVDVTVRQAETIAHSRMTFSLQ